MRNVSQPDLPRRCAGLGVVACGATMFILALASGVLPGLVSTAALADPGPCGGHAQPAEEPKPPAAGQAGQKPDRIQVGPPQPVTIKQLTGGEGPPAPSEEPKPVTEGPPPKWVCANATLTLDPIWQGKPLAATWVVKNEGEGDLVIKLKGG